MIEKWFEPFMLLRPLRSNDGLGACPALYADDIPFQGVLTYTAGDEITAGGRAALKSTPVLLYDPDVTLSHGDHIRREKDGSLYRVCANSLHAPPYSGLRFSQVLVEKEEQAC